MNATYPGGPIIIFNYAPLVLDFQRPFVICEGKDRRGALFLPLIAWIWRDTIRVSAHRNPISGRSS